MHSSHTVHTPSVHAQCIHQRNKFKELYETDCVKTPLIAWAKKCRCMPCGDWTCYRQRYPDISTLSEDDAAKHYNNVGILESRTCMCDSLSGHSSGKPEAMRLASQKYPQRADVSCNWGCYRDRYPDIAAMDNVHAARHYIDWGAAAGRLCTCEFAETTNGQVNAKYEYMLQSSVFQVTLLPKDNHHHEY
jgi:hypothetical protein